MSVNDNELYHYGVKKRSGRYPWGSGDSAYQHSGDFLSRVSELKKSGKSEKEIADSMEISTGLLRTQIGIATVERRTLLSETARGLREKGYTLDQIAEKMGYKNDSSIRSLLNPSSESRMKEARSTADFIKEQVDKKGMVDVGKGVERELNISPAKLEQALYIAEMEGYPVYGGGVAQINNRGKQTTIKVICPPGTEHKDIYEYEKVHSLNEYSTHNDGKTFETMKYPASLNPNRLGIRYKEDGGIQKDGTMEIRRGVPDLDLGGSHYSQVRILVGKDKYLKGMAVYSDKLPDGVDIVFNTNKKKGTPVDKVLKQIHLEDPDNPFGSYIKKGGQSYYIDKNGKRQLSVVNKRADENDWTEWKDKLPAQFLAKQNRSLIKKQLDLAQSSKQAEYEDIMSLTNPTLKKKLLEDFSRSCDSDSVRLYAAALPGQKYHVILPVNTLKDTEVYAPNYETGTKLALVRFPHGGTFEIPILTVNNRNKLGIDMIGKNAKDAVGINSTVAERLSGADFDGDTVMTVPHTDRIKITSTPPLKSLEGFDPKMEYAAIPNMKKMKNTQNEMGQISNLITDMTLKGAPPEKLARAVKHSMVVIDAEKHSLNYKLSEQQNQIKSLKDEYQGHITDAGDYSTAASTLLSRAKSQATVIKRQGSPRIDPKTGELIYKNVDDPYYVNPKTGKTGIKTQKSTQMAEQKDAHALSSGTPKEELYADHANKLKSMANKARKEVLGTKDIPPSKEAKAKYAEEYATLNASLNIAEMNSPKERHAQTIANAKLKAIKQDNPDITKEMMRKIGQQELDRARIAVGARREKIAISDKEWEAIQAGAISPTKLRKILDNADTDIIRQKATPKDRVELTSTQVSRISAMKELGYTNAEIANRMGKSVSTITRYL